MEASNPHNEMERDQVQFQNLDMINHLPPNVIDIILTCLPLRDAVRTSILSCDWRYKWVTIPHLTFDHRSFLPELYGLQEFNELKAVNAVDQVLIVHRGPIQKFECQNYPTSCLAINRWILHLSDNGVESFTLDLLQDESAECYKVPSCLFRCKNLIHLQMSYCIFKPPSKFEGFHSLKTLHLRNVTIDKSFEDLISKCPFLEALTLKEFESPTRLRIRCPNLLYLDVCYGLNYLYFENMPLVTTANIQMSVLFTYKKSKESTLIKVLGCLHGVKWLTLDGYLLQFLAAGDVPERLPTPFDHLKNLTLNINFQDLDQLSVALCLCRNSLNVREIYIRANLINTTGMPSERFWEGQEGFDGLFANLRIVTITGIIGSKNELGFVEFVLTHAPVLEEMNINIRAENMNGIILRTRRANEESRIFRDLLGFRRASPQARIISLGLN